MAQNDYNPHSYQSVPTFSLDASMQKTGRDELNTENATISIIKMEPLLGIDDDFPVQQEVDPENYPIAWDWEIIKEEPASPECPEEPASPEFPEEPFEPETPLQDAPEPKLNPLLDHSYFQSNPENKGPKQAEFDSKANTDSDTAEDSSLTDDDVEVPEWMKNKPPSPTSKSTDYFVYNEIVSSLSNTSLKEKVQRRSPPAILRKFLSKFPNNSCSNDPSKADRLPISSSGQEESIGSDLREEVAAPEEESEKHGLQSICRGKSKQRKWRGGRKRRKRKRGRSSNAHRLKSVLNHSDSNRSDKGNDALLNSPSRLESAEGKECHPLEALSDVLKHSQVEKEEFLSHFSLQQSGSTMKDLGHVTKSKKIRSCRTLRKRLHKSPGTLLNNELETPVDLNFEKFNSQSFLSNLKTHNHSILKDVSNLNKCSKCGLNLHLKPRLLAQDFKNSNPQCFNCFFCCASYSKASKSGFKAHLGAHILSFFFKCCNKELGISLNFDYDVQALVEKYSSKSIGKKASVKLKDKNSGNTYDGTIIERNNYDSENCNSGNNYDGAIIERNGYVSENCGSGNNYDETIFENNYVSENYESESLNASHQDFDFDQQMLSDGEYSIENEVDLCQDYFETETYFVDSSQHIPEISETYTLPSWEPDPQFSGAISPDGSEEDRTDQLVCQESPSDTEELFEASATETLQTISKPSASLSTIEEKFNLVSDLKPRHFVKLNYDSSLSDVLPGRSLSSRKILSYLSEEEIQEHRLRVENGCARLPRVVVTPVTDDFIRKYNLSLRLARRIKERIVMDAETWKRRVKSKLEKIDDDQARSSFQECKNCRSNFVKHSKVDSITKIGALFPCDKCFRTFKNEWSFEMHVRAIHPFAGPFCCYLCKVVCNTWCQFVFHIKLHDLNRFLCRNCSISVDRNIRARSHAALISLAHDTNINFNGHSRDWYLKGQLNSINSECVSDDSPSIDVINNIIGIQPSMDVINDIIGIEPDSLANRLSADFLESKALSIMAPSKRPSKVRTNTALVRKIFPPRTRSRKFKRRRGRRKFSKPVSALSSQDTAGIILDTETQVVGTFSIPQEHSYSKTESKSEDVSTTSDLDAVNERLDPLASQINASVRVLTEYCSKPKNSKDFDIFEIFTTLTSRNSPQRMEKLKLPSEKPPRCKEKLPPKVEETPSSVTVPYSLPKEVDSPTDQNQLEFPLSPLFVSDDETDDNSSFLLDSLQHCKEILDKDVSEKSAEFPAEFNLGPPAEPDAEQLTEHQHEEALSIPSLSEQQRALGLNLQDLPIVILPSDLSESEAASFGQYNCEENRPSKIEDSVVETGLALTGDEIGLKALSTSALPKALPGLVSAVTGVSALLSPRCQSYEKMPSEQSSDDRVHDDSQKFNFSSDANIPESSLYINTGDQALCQSKEKASPTKCLLSDINGPLLIASNDPYLTASNDPHLTAGDDPKQQGQPSEMTPVYGDSPSCLSSESSFQAGPIIPTDSDPSKKGQICYQDELSQRKSGGDSSPSLLSESEDQVQISSEKRHLNDIDQGNSSILLHPYDLENQNVWTSTQITQLSSETSLQTHQADANHKPESESCSIPHLEFEMPRNGVMSGVSSVTLTDPYNDSCPAGVTDIDYSDTIDLRSMLAELCERVASMTASDSVSDSYSCANNPQNFLVSNVEPCSSMFDASDSNNCSLSPTLPFFEFDQNVSAEKRCEPLDLSTPSSTLSVLQPTASSIRSFPAAVSREPELKPLFERSMSPLGQRKSFPVNLTKPALPERLECPQLITARDTDYSSDSSTDFEEDFVSTVEFAENESERQCSNTPPEFSLQNVDQGSDVDSKLSGFISSEPLNSCEVRLSDSDFSSVPAVVVETVESLVSKAEKAVPDFESELTCEKFDGMETVGDRSREGSPILGFQSFDCPDGTDNCIDSILLRMEEEEEALLSSRGKGLVSKRSPTKLALKRLYGSETSEKTGSDTDSNYSLRLSAHPCRVFPSLKKPVKKRRFLGKQSNSKLLSKSPELLGKETPRIDCKVRNGKMRRRDRAQRQAILCQEQGRGVNGRFLKKGGDSDVHRRVSHIFDHSYAASKKPVTSKSCGSLKSVSSLSVYDFDAASESGSVSGCSARVEANPPGAQRKRPGRRYYTGRKRRRIKKFSLNLNRNLNSPSVLSDESDATMTQSRPASTKVPEPHRIRKPRKVYVVQQRSLRPRLSCESVGKISSSESEILARKSSSSSLTPAEHSVNEEGKKCQLGSSSSSKVVRKDEEVVEKPINGPGTRSAVVDKTSSFGNESKHKKRRRFARRFCYRTLRSRYCNTKSQDHSSPSQEESKVSDHPTNQKETSERVKGMTSGTEDARLRVSAIKGAKKRKTRSQNNTLKRAENNKVVPEKDIKNTRATSSVVEFERRSRSEPVSNTATVRKRRKRTSKRLLFTARKRRTSQVSKNDTSEFDLNDSNVNGNSGSEVRKRRKRHSKKFLFTRKKRRVARREPLPLDNTQVDSNESTAQEHSVANIPKSLSVRTKLKRRHHLKMLGKSSNSRTSSSPKSGINQDLNNILAESVEILSEVLQSSHPSPNPTDAFSFAVSQVSEASESKENASSSSNCPNSTSSPEKTVVKDEISSDTNDETVAKPGQRLSHRANRGNRLTEFCLMIRVPALPRKPKHDVDVFNSKRSPPNSRIMNRGKRKLKTTRELSKVSAASSVRSRRLFKTRKEKMLGKQSIVYQTIGRTLEVSQCNLTDDEKNLASQKASTECCADDNNRVKIDAAPKPRTGCGRLTSKHQLPFQKRCFMRLPETANLVFTSVKSKEDTISGEVNSCVRTNLKRRRKRQKSFKRNLVFRKGRYLKYRKSSEENVSMEGTARMSLKAPNGSGTGGSFKVPQGDSKSVDKFCTPSITENRQQLSGPLDMLTHNVTGESPAKEGNSSGGGGNSQRSDLVRLLRKVRKPELKLQRVDVGSVVSKTPEKVPLSDKKSEKEFEKRFLSRLEVSQCLGSELSEGSESDVSPCKSSPGRQKLTENQVTSPKMRKKLLLRGHSPNSLKNEETPPKRRSAPGRTSDKTDTEVSDPELKPLSKSDPCKIPSNLKRGINKKAKQSCAEKSEPSEISLRRKRRQETKTLNQNRETLCKVTKADKNSKCPPIETDSSMTSLETPLASNTITPLAVKAESKEAMKLFFSVNLPSLKPAFSETNPQQFETLTKLPPLTPVPESPKKSTAAKPMAVKKVPEPGDESGNSSVFDSFSITKSEIANSTSLFLPQSDKPLEMDKLSSNGMSSTSTDLNNCGLTSCNMEVEITSIISPKGSLNELRNQGSESNNRTSIQYLTPTHEIKPLAKGDKETVLMHMSQKMNQICDTSSADSNTPKPAKVSIQRKTDSPRCKLPFTESEIVKTSPQNCDLKRNPCDSQSWNHAPLSDDLEGQSYPSESNFSIRYDDLNQNFEAKSKEAWSTSRHEPCYQENTFYAPRNDAHSNANGFVTTDVEKVPSRTFEGNFGQFHERNGYSTGFQEHNSTVDKPAHQFYPDFYSDRLEPVQTPVKVHTDSFQTTYSYSPHLLREFSPGNRQPPQPVGQNFNSSQFGTGAQHGVGVGTYNPQLSEFCPSGNPSKVWGSFSSNDWNRHPTMPVSASFVDGSQEPSLLNPNETVYTAL